MKLKKENSTHLIDEAFVKINSANNEELDEIVSIIEMQPKKPLHAKVAKIPRLIKSKLQRALA